MRTRTAAMTASVGGVLMVLAAGVAPATAGVTGPAIYVDGTAYRTVATPTDLSGTGGPDASFDVIYDFGGHQLNVATAAPGDRDYNGGRWRVHALAFPAMGGYGAALASGDLNGNGVLDSDAELNAALAAGTAADTGVVKSFVCPVIPLPRGHR